MLSTAIFLRAGLLAVAGLQGSSGAERLVGWDWAVGDQATEPLAWRHADEPWVEVGGDRPISLWLRAPLPSSPSSEPIALFFPTQPRAFEVILDGQVLYSYPGSSSDTPWHLVPMPEGTGGRTLLLHSVWRPNRLGFLGFPFGVRAGPRADIYLWMIREDWKATALALLFVFTALIAAAAHVAAAARKEDRPYAALAVLCVLNAVWVITDQAQYLTGLIIEDQNLHRFWWVTGPLGPLAELWYMERIYGRRLRFGMRPIVALLAAFGLGLGLTRMAGLSTIHDSTYWYSTLVLNALALLAAVSTLLNIASIWETCSGKLKIVTLGLILEQICCVVDSIECLALTNLPRPTGVGFASFLIFVLASPVVVGLEARAREERERAQNARARAITQTTAMFAHDVRKPFALLRATLDALSTPRTMREVSEVLRTARAEVADVTRSVEAMIADILEAASDAPIETHPEDLRSILASVLASLPGAESAWEVSVRYTLTHTRLLTVHRARVERAVANIVGNALEAMRGRGALWFESKDVTHDRRSYVALTIGNSGSHIPPEHISKIFEPFFTAGKRNGTGLGLAIAKKVVDAHGGTITCRSSLDRGVELTLLLPAGAVLGTEGEPSALPDHLGGQAEPGRKAPRSADQSGPYVILVEDSKVMRRAWRKTLPPGVLREFASPSLCLQAAREDPGLLQGARCIILDNRFTPGEIDGVTLGEILRKDTSVPIILSSGVHEDFLPSCFDDQIAKEPLDEEALTRVLARSSEAQRNAS